MSQELTCETCGAALDAEATLCLHCGAPGPAVAAGGDEVYRETGFRSQALPVAAGDVLSGRFRLLRALGRGGMGVVWLASDEELDGQHVALKVLRPEIAADSGGVADMKREVIITRALRHPNIVAVYDHHTEGGRVFITMAYIDGPSLADALTARERKPYALEEVLPWARQVAEALDYAHGRGVLHRDVKPGNILLAQDGTAHLTDFGIARMARDTLSRRSGHTASGTLAYMSPQQLLDEKAHRNDPRNDVYSFAATLYELLSGEPPFSSGGIEAQIALKQPDPIESVPDYVNEAVLQGLAKEVAQRPENCAALVHVLSGDAASTQTERNAGASTPTPGEVRTFVSGAFAWIPPGTFEMGSKLSPKQVVEAYGGEDDWKRYLEAEHPRHTVTLTKGFWLGTTEVTNREFARFVEATGYETDAEKAGEGRTYVPGDGWGKQPGIHWRGPGWDTKPEEPVVLVSWNDAVAYCEWLSEETGQRHRLPTEAEWEYACRAGTTTVFWWGDSAADGQGKLNGADETKLPDGKSWKHKFPFSGGYWRTAPVGLFTANGWNLHDMLGNVWEWCSDGYASDYYGRSPAEDPHNTTQTDRRVLRGGSWNNNPIYCRSAHRSNSTPAHANTYHGFRVVRTQ